MTQHRPSWDGRTFELGVRGRKLENYDVVVREQDVDHCDAGAVTVGHDKVCCVTGE